MNSIVYNRLVSSNSFVWATVHPANRASRKISIEFLVTLHPAHEFNNTGKEERGSSPSKKKRKPARLSASFPPLVFENTRLLWLRTRSPAACHDTKDQICHLLTIHGLECNPLGETGLGWTVWWAKKRPGIGNSSARWLWRASRWSQQQ